MKHSSSSKYSAEGDYTANDQQGRYAGARMEDSNLDIPMELGLTSDPDAPNHYENMTKEQKRKVLTEFKQGKDDGNMGMSSTEMGQLVDRKASNNFQG